MLMTPDEARALIAEGHETFDAHEAGWRRDKELAWLWANGRALLTGYASALDEVERLRKVASEVPGLSAALDESRWERDSLRPGNPAAAQALAEIGRLSGSIDRANALLDERDATITSLTQLASDRYEEAEELHAMHGDATQTARPTIAALRAEVGELKLVLEQQDRDAERMRAVLLKARDWAKADHRENERDLRAAIADILSTTGEPCTDVTKK